MGPWRADLRTQESFERLGLLPQRFHIGKAHVRKPLLPLARALFDESEPLLEAEIGRAQGRLCVDTLPSREVDQG